jgi:CheY-like chemotaxis protein
MSRVLVAEDDRQVCTLVGRALSLDHDVTAVCDGRAALAALCEKAFDAVVCDLRMPHLSGIDLYDLVSAARPLLATRFVFITGALGLPREAAFLERCHRPVIQKPFQIGFLRSIVSRLTGSEIRPW